jgi:RNA polymerase sigma factor (sigma-70 family)
MAGPVDLTGRGGVRLHEQRRRVLEIVYRDHLNGLVRYLRTKLANRAEVEEIAQEAYLRLCHADAADRVHNPHGFLYRTASNLVVDRYRERRFQVGSLDGDGSSPPIEIEALESQPDEAAAIAQELAALRAAIFKLPARCRLVFVLHRLKGMTQSEVAGHLGISRQMVEKHLAKALARCREQLRPLR